MRNEIIRVALAEVGTKEKPSGSNTVKYNTWFYGKEVKGPSYAWCGAFASWVFDTAGLPLGVIDYTRGYAGTNYAVNNVHKWGKVVSRDDVKPGDLAFFDFDGNKRWDHTGIFKQDLGNDIFECIEGNTAIGNDSNGGEVMVRQRRYSVAIFIRPNVLTAKEILI
jgi:hypothetical protein